MLLRNRLNNFTINSIQSCFIHYNVYTNKFKHIYNYILHNNKRRRKKKFKSLRQYNILFWAINLLLLSTEPTKKIQKQNNNAVYI